MEAQRHSLRRTSPKGGPFIGVCVLCGTTGLPFEAAIGFCSNQRGLTEDEAVVEAVTGELSHPEEGHHPRRSEARRSQGDGEGPRHQEERGRAGARQAGGWGMSKTEEMLLERALGILHRMATERTDWRTFRRWYYSDEPLRNDAANLVREAGFDMPRPLNTRLVGE